MPENIIRIDRHMPGPDSTGSSRRRIRTNNMIERLNREIRRRTRVVGSFPDGNSAGARAYAYGT